MADKRTGETMAEIVHQTVEKMFADPEAQAIALAGEIGKRLHAAVVERGGALIAVSGGKSPIRLFQLLSQADLPWSAITITLVDERWVTPDNEASNERLVRDHLMVGHAAAAHFVPLKNGAATPEEGTAACDVALAKLSLPFDIVVLGMGDDGHTASFFPQAPGLIEALDTNRDALCAAVRPQTAPHPRMTLTLRVLQASRWLVLPLQGEAKMQTYRKALEDGPVELMPVRSVLRQTVAPVEIWISN
jgi:6-phosphogluconolactonase